MEIFGRLRRLPTHRAAARRLASGASSIVMAAGLVLAQPASVSAAPTTAQLIGQKLVVAMSGTTPSASLLGRVTRGEIGGVILFSANITSASQLATLTSKLRAAATAGRQPPLLIATDQEGGSVKRISWAPPTLTVPQMGKLDNVTTTTAQGRDTGTILACAGINSALSPVADVPASTSSFMYQQGRTWSFSASVTANMADAFASGLEAGGDVPTMKHFPGLGYAALNTDTHVVTITASKTQLAPGLTPYQKAFGHGLPIVMLSNATYSAYDGVNAAGWSHAISVGLLRTTLGFTGVSMTDSLSGIAAARGVTTSSLAIKAAQAGTDMILVTGSESNSAAVYSALVNAKTAGSISTTTLQASYSRILALKASLPAPTHDTTTPTMKAPVSRLYAGSLLGTSTVSVRTSWSASDPCGISRYSLDRSTNGAAWAAQSLPTALSTSLAQSLVRGSTYRYTARATDGAGNTASWTSGSAFRPLLSEQTSTAITYHGTWYSIGNTYASGGTLRYSTATGASATYSFTASSVAWVAMVGPSRGSAAVYLDGIHVATINLYSATFGARRIVYAASFSTSGPHTLRIVNLGTAGHSRVDVDAFVRLVPA
jgi:beta-N-acetylhexosaminidase